MAQRRRGVLEERLRTAIRLRIKGHRGRNKELAAAIDRQSSWVSDYMDGRNHANLDTSLALMRYLGWSLEKELRDMLPAADPDLVHALRDQELATLAKRLDTAAAETRGVAIGLVTTLLDHEEMRRGAQSTAPGPGRTREESTRPARARRR